MEYFGICIVAAAYILAKAYCKVHSVELEI